MASILEQIAETSASGQPAVVITVVRATGSTPRGAGAKMLVRADGRTAGTIGGGRVEHSAIATAESVLAEGAPRLVEHKLTAELGMCCGGTVTLFFEPVLPADPLLIFGAGHVSVALCRQAAQAGFRVHVVDERQSLCTPERFGGATALHDLNDADDLPFCHRTFVVITTHDHALDQRLLERALRKPHRWLGVIGSARKAELTRQRLRHRGFEPEKIERVRCPIGLDIGAETPAEIAISILAELVAVRRERAIDPGTPRLETKRST